MLSCSEGLNNPQLGVRDFIKPKFSYYQSIFSCTLNPSSNLSLVESFVPKLLTEMQLYNDQFRTPIFLFPTSENSSSIQFFKIIYKFQQLEASEEMIEAMNKLNFNNIALCDEELRNIQSMNLINQTKLKSPYILEILNCKYIAPFNYGSFKSYIDDLINIVISSSLDIGMSYSEEVDQNKEFMWINTFSSKSSRKKISNKWLSQPRAKEVQSSFLEHSICSESKLFDAYKLN